MLDRTSVEKRLSTMEIPTLPEVMTRVIEAASSDTASAADLTAILQCDHAISARILRIANSAFFGFQGKVDSLRRAVALIGFDTVRFLAMATSVFDYFSGRHQNVIDVRRFWMHAVGAARAVEMLGRKLPGIFSVEACYTGALLQDMGIILMALEYPTEYRKVIEIASESPLYLTEIERGVLGLDHVEIGAWVAQAWHLPPLIVNLIQHSHDEPEETVKLEPEYTVVRLAHSLADISGFGFDWVSPESVLSSLYGIRLGLAPAEIDDLREALSEMQEDATELMDLIVLEK
ncbi:TPA: hypothetical protein DDW35_10175 [Candidatus Sumerlaeota bacterium]|jgi:HD-like signal output (HDOD) protein|nr:hypothetical protein [Candidatus Sumerlaeota bacterium]